MKFEDLEGWKRSSRLCADLYKHFQDIIDMLLLTTDNKTIGSHLKYSPKSYPKVNRIDHLTSIVACVYYAHSCNFQRMTFRRLL